MTVPSAEVTVSTGGSPLSEFLAGETSGQCGIHRPPPRAGLVITAAGFLIEGNRVKIFSGNPEEDSLAERRAEPPSV
jgi:hypothetical protein